MDEQSNPVITWPLDPVTQKSLERWMKVTRYVLFKVIEPSTSHTASTTFGGDLEIPFDGQIVEIGAFVDTAGVTGTAVIDVNKNGTTMMVTNKIKIDTAEKTSRTATLPAQLTTVDVKKGDILTVDVDTIQTTPAKGLTVFLTIQT